MDINSSIRELKGIGDKTGKTFEKLGVYSILDMLLAFPRDYRKMPSCETVSSLMQNQEQAVEVVLVGTPIVKNRNNLSLTFAKAADHTGELHLVWFRSPYIKNSLKSGESYIFYGKPIWKNNQLTMEQPEIYTKEKYAQLQESYQPIYSLSKGITNNLFCKTMKQACDVMTEDIEFLPADILKRQGLVPYHSAIREMHFPTTLEALQKAHDRLAFNEFFLFLIQMKLLKGNHDRTSNHCLMQDTSVVNQIIDRLPYSLTNAQNESIQEILKDMKGQYMMQRLLQGDVGSGKTIVAFIAMAVAASNGYQAAIMAPTEVLARQHYENFLSWCKEFSLDFPVFLLTGSVKAKEKRELYKRIEQKKGALIIGTHALIQEKLNFHSLGLVITDEQHRFGVRQREAFATKGISPHILVMSATPIPRTLAIILYGDFDISLMKELPAKRLPIKNCVVDEGYRTKMYDFIKKEIADGHQVYIICPLVEESENLDAQNVMDYTMNLTEQLGHQISVAYLHGKMKAEEKYEIMDLFQKNEIQVLVSTTVIEVGVNVPNATVMMIENAERFGLAQLHQLRGRVGRGNAQSYCILVNGSKTKQAKKRLDILNHSNDGFEIAKMDLKLRGPGDFFGIRQSGLMEFQVGDVLNDASILAAASKECDALLEDEATINYEKNKRLYDVVQKYRMIAEDKMNI